MVMTGATETLAGFFEPPNEISLEALPEELGTLLGELVELAFTDQPRRTVLPARSGGLTRWYGFSPSSVEERLLLEEIRSWVGSPIGSRVQHVLLDIDRPSRSTCPTSGRGPTSRADDHR
jgi:hypothetical protein